MSCRAPAIPVALALALLLAPVAAHASPPASACDPIGGPACLLPFPNDHFTRADRSTPTGLRLALDRRAMPANTRGVRIDPRDINRADGFSPTSMLVAHMPGLDARRSRLPAFTDPAASRAAGAPVVLLDARTARRVPIGAELDAQVPRAAERALLIRPLQSLTPGHRYVVALRDLRDARGRRLPAPAAFARIRDGRPRGRAERTRARQLAGAMAVLRRAGIARDGALQLAWTFTVASDRSLTGRMLTLRDRAFAALGDRDLADRRIAGRAPAFTVTSVTDLAPEQDPHVVRRIRGTVKTPCFLTSPGCRSGGTFRLDARGVPRGPFGSYGAPFVCDVGRSLVDPATGTGRAGLPLLYGHGLLGSKEEAVRNPAAGQTADAHGLVTCATDWSGMAVDDIPTVTAKILTDLSNFPMLADRVQQGMLAFLLLGRAMAHPQGFAAHEAFRFGGVPVVGDGRLAFNGNSQGGIIGGALTAVAPDFRHAILGVPGMTYSTLLDRSIDFDAFGGILYANYARDRLRPLGMQLIQLLWDRAEASGYATRATDRPLPGTPSHRVLLLMAWGDHQVSNLTTLALARSMGAPVRTPALGAGRVGPWQAALDLVPRLGALAHAGSATVVMDSGPLRTDPVTGKAIGAPAMPVGNVAPRGGEDPHGLGGSSADVRALVAAFARDGVVPAGACGGGVCGIGGWTP